MHATGRGSVKAVQAPAAALNTPCCRVPCKPSRKCPHHSPLTAAAAPPTAGGGGEEEDEPEDAAYNALLARRREERAAAIREASRRTRFNPLNRSSAPGQPPAPSQAAAAPLEQQPQGQPGSSGSASKNQAQVPSSVKGERAPTSTSSRAPGVAGRRSDGAPLRTSLSSSRRPSTRGFSSSTSRRCAAHTSCQA